MGTSGSNSSPVSTRSGQKGYQRSGSGFPPSRKGGKGGIQAQTSAGAQRSAEADPRLALVTKLRAQATEGRNSSASSESLLLPDWLCEILFLLKNAEKDLVLCLLRETRTDGRPKQLTIPDLMARTQKSRQAVEDAIHGLLGLGLLYVEAVHLHWANSPCRYALIAPSNPGGGLPFAQPDGTLAILLFGGVLYPVIPAGLKSGPLCEGDGLESRPSPGGAARGAARSAARWDGLENGPSQGAGDGLLSRSSLGNSASGRGLPSAAETGLKSGLSAAQERPESRPSPRQPASVLPRTLPNEDSLNSRPSMLETAAGVDVSIAQRQRHNSSKHLSDVDNDNTDNYDVTTDTGNTVIKQKRNKREETRGKKVAQEEISFPQQLQTSDFPAASSQEAHQLSLLPAVSMVASPTRPGTEMGQPGGAHGPSERKKACALNKNPLYPVWRQLAGDIQQSERPRFARGLADLLEAGVTPASLRALIRVYRTWGNYILSPQALLRNRTRLEENPRYAIFLAEGLDTSSSAAVSQAPLAPAEPGSSVEACEVAGVDAAQETDEERDEEEEAALRAFAARLTQITPNLEKFYASDSDTRNVETLWLTLRDAVYASGLSPARRYHLSGVVPAFDPEHPEVLLLLCQLKFQADLINYNLGPTLASALVQSSWVSHYFQRVRAMSCPHTWLAPEVQAQAIERWGGVVA
jgi:hypothetical protein